MIADILNRAADRLEQPNAWSQHVMATTASRQVVAARDPRACQWCSMGAISAETDDPNIRFCVDGALRAAINSRSIAHWNDAPGRTQTEVVAAFRKAASCSAT